MFARSIESYRESYFSHVFFMRLSLSGLQGIFQNIKVKTSPSLEIFMFSVGSIELQEKPNPQHDGSALKLQTAECSEYVFCVTLATTLCAYAHQLIAPVS